jgi:hypothetical protein
LNDLYNLEEKKIFYRMIMNGGDAELIPFSKYCLRTDVKG